VAPAVPAAVAAREAPAVLAVMAVLAASVSVVSAVAAVPAVPVALAVPAARAVPEEAYSSASAPAWDPIDQGTGPLLRGGRFLCSVNSRGRQSAGGASEICPRQRGRGQGSSPNGAAPRANAHQGK
jgi:hypothetical protein